MNEVMNVNEVQTMSSREIAELTGKRHDHVLRDIDTLSPNLGSLSKTSTYSDSNGIPRRCWLLTKRDTLLLVSGYNVELRARIIDRWQELENAVRQNTPAIPQTLSEALRLAADLAEEKERLALENKTLAPKAAVCDAIVKNDMHRTASEVGKALGMSAIKLNRKLEAVGVYDLRCRRRVFSQWFIDEGYGKMRVTHDGYEQAVFTAKGQVWITELFTCH